MQPLVPVERETGWPLTTGAPQAASWMEVCRVKVCQQERFKLESGGVPLSSLSYVLLMVSVASEVLGRIGIHFFGLDHVDHNNQGLYLLVGEIPSFESQINPNVSFQLAVIVPLYLRIHWAYDYSLSYLSYLAFSTPSSYDYIVVGAGSAGQVFWSLNF